MLPKSILQGYDKVTRKLVAQMLGIALKDKHKGGDHHRMKIPMGALKKDKKTKDTKKSGVKFGMLKGKKMVDKDADGY